MRSCTNHTRGPHRRAVVAVQVAVLSVVLIGFAALAVDVGALYNTRSDLQRTADAAALAAASKLGEYDTSGGSPVELARQVAIEYVTRNAVLGKTMGIDPSLDIVFGRATLNQVTQTYDFTPTNVVPDAVYIRVRHTADSPNGSVPLYFARIFGLNDTEMAAEALAIMVPRDIAIVADLSGSHNDDSEMRSYRRTTVNLYDVWDALPGGTDGIAGLQQQVGDLNLAGNNSDGENSYQGAGPAWGYMKKLGFGDETINASYNPYGDPGLIALPKGVDWTNADLDNDLADRGYSTDEIDAIMDSNFDTFTSDPWPYRTAVAMGWATWYSGMPGGLWETLGVDQTEAGNGNDWVGSTEITWDEQIFSMSLDQSRDVWLDYTTYMSQGSTRLARGFRGIRYRFGIKTFLNYLLERRPGHEQSPELAQTPSQPMQAVKDAVTYMAGLISNHDSDDQLSLEIYGTTAHHEVDLTHNHAEVSERLNQMQAGHYDSWTNMGGGLQTAIEELTSPRARSRSRKMIILLTDGNANVDASGAVNNVAGGNSYALQQAQIASAQGILVFAVSVGAGANQSLMSQIADTGQGEHYHAQGTIDQYSQQLAEIFAMLSGDRQVELVR